MIHPSTALKFINEQKGYGVFATEFIPKGTITYVKDPLEIEVNPTQFALLSPDMQFHVEKYCYMDQFGMRIVSWDMGKYINHCCNSNTMSTGYGFEIAIRNIAEGEEITDEYGLFNISESMNVACGNENCRNVIQSTDLDAHYRDWDKKVRPSIMLHGAVHQPLWHLLDAKVREQLNEFNQNRKAYISVKNLKYAGVNAELNGHPINK